MAPSNSSATNPMSNPMSDAMSNAMPNAMCVAQSNSGGRQAASRERPCNHVTRYASRPVPDLFHWRRFLLLGYVGDARRQLVTVIEHSAGHVLSTSKLDRHTPIGNLVIIICKRASRHNDFSAVFTKIPKRQRSSVVSCEWLRDSLKKRQQMPLENYKHPVFSHAKYFLATVRPARRGNQLHLSDYNVINRLNSTSYVEPSTGESSNCNTMRWSEKHGSVELMRDSEKAVPRETRHSSSLAHEFAANLANAVVSTPLSRTVSTAHAVTRSPQRLIVDMTYTVKKKKRPRHCTSSCTSSCTSCTRSERRSSRATDRDSD